MLHGTAARAMGVFSVVLCLWIGGVGQAGHVLKTHDIDFEAPVHTLGEPVSWGEDWPPAKMLGWNYEPRLTVVEGLDGQACQMGSESYFNAFGWHDFFTSDPYTYTVESETVEVDMQIDSITANESFVCAGVVTFGSDGNIRHAGQIVGQYALGFRFHLRIHATDQTIEIHYNDTELYNGPFASTLSYTLGFRFSSNSESQALIDNFQAFMELSEPILILSDPYLGCGVEAGSDYPVEWCATADVNNVLVEYSGDYGESWSPVGVVESPYGFEWSVPQEASDFSRIRVSSAEFGLVSEMPFRVYVKPPALPEYELIDLTDLLSLPHNSYFIRMNDCGSIIGLSEMGFFAIVEGILYPINFWPDDLNNLNQVVGFKQINGQDFCMLWENGQETPLFCLDENPGPYGNSYDIHINDSMEIAVSIADGSGPGELLVWSDQQVQYRGGIDGLSGIGNFKINNAGVIAGGGNLLSGTATEPDAAFLLENGQVQVYDPSLYPGLQSFYMSDFNNSGVLLCREAELAFGNDIVTADMLINDGKAVFVRDRNLNPWAGGLWAINDQGYAAGSYYTDIGLEHSVILPYLYNGGKLVNLRDLVRRGDVKHLYATDINNLNYILLGNCDLLKEANLGVLAPIREELGITNVSHTLPEAVRFDETAAFKVIALYEDGLPRDYTERAEIVFEPNGVLAGEDGVLRVLDMPAADVTVTVTVTCEHGGTAVSEAQEIRVAAPHVLRVPDAYPTIRAAIEAALDGDTVLLADGVYTGEGNRDLSYGGKAIAVRSENGPEGCILDLEGSEDEPHFAFVFDQGETPASVLEGVTIRNGWSERGIVTCEEASPVIENCFFSANLSDALFLLYSENAVILNCSFVGNWSNAGGVIFANESRVKCQGCSFEKNIGNSSGAFTQRGGECILQNCILRNNIGEGGGAIDIGADRCEITDCLFEGNDGMYAGGVGIVHGDSSLLIERCRFVGNSIANEESEYEQAIFNVFTEAGGIIKQSIFEGNFGTGGGVIFILAYPTNIPVEITNCTLVNNRGNPNGAIQANYVSARIQNCILHNEGNEILLLSPEASVEVSYTNLTGGWEGVGNLDVDPLFVREGYWDPNGTPGVLEDDVWVSGDYHLQSAGWRWDTARGAWTWDEATSLCVDAGCPGDGLGEEPTAVAADPLGRWGANVRIDMGCYGGTVEAGMAPPGWRRLSDVTNDWRTDADDLAVLAGMWLEAAAGLPGDLDRSGGVGLGDLAVMAGEW